jgi:quinohemoprotein ethanol dehydrogenase
MNFFRLCVFSLMWAFFGQYLCAATVVNDESLTAEGDGSNWLGFGRNYSEQRYSPLDQINTKTVSNLGIEWVMELPKDKSLLATPLVVDGVIYFTASYSVTRAVEAKTGKLLWEFDPESIKMRATGWSTCGIRIKVRPSGMGR